MQMPTISIMSSIPLAPGVRASLAVFTPDRSSGEEIKKASNPAYSVGTAALRLAIVSVTA